MSRGDHKSLSAGWACWRNLDEGFYPLHHRSYTDATNMDVVSCIKFCKSEGFLFSGILSGATCFCGSEIDINSEQVDSAECNAGCVGNKKHQCGSMTDAISIYGLTDTLQFAWARVGCFETSAKEPTLSTQWGTQRPFTFSDNSPVNCASTCLDSYAFFGLQDGDQCTCGVEINEKTARVSDELCNVPCPGSSTTCGGTEYMEVYGTRLPRVQPDATPSAPPVSASMAIPEGILAPTKSLGTLHSPRV